MADIRWRDLSGSGVGKSRPSDCLPPSGTLPPLCSPPVAVNPHPALLSWHRSSPEAPSFHGRYPASPVLQASPPPCRPSLALTSCRFGACLTTHRASHVATLFPFHACWRHYPGVSRSVPASLASRSANGLPLLTGGSAPASPVSRPARRSLAFRPAWSLNRPRRPVDTTVLQTISLPP